MASVPAVLSSVSSRCVRVEVAAAAAAAAAAMTVGGAACKLFRSRSVQGPQKHRLGVSVSAINHWAGRHRTPRAARDRGPEEAGGGRGRGREGPLPPQPRLVPAGGQVCSWSAARRRQRRWQILREASTAAAAAAASYAAAAASAAAAAVSTYVRLPPHRPPPPLRPPRRAAAEAAPLARVPTRRKRRPHSFEGLAAAGWPLACSRAVTTFPPPRYLDESFDRRRGRGASRAGESRRGSRRLL